ncbi:MAG: hypothetical protein IPP31_05585 [Chitinophagaceae bacterium]|nr:hypothetical protein [Chitinophagaceae bacterium]
MGKIRAFVLMIGFSFLASSAWAQDVNQLQETARIFMTQGDYANAILVLNRAHKLQPGNMEVSKSLGLNYYFAKDYAKALEIYKPLLESEDADDQCFQVAGDIYMVLDEVKECEKVYRKGLKKFPSSGPLYNELGELLWTKKDYTAIKYWEKGIETDPGFSKNYYNACLFYYFSTDKIWSLLYGETFLNIEPRSSLAGEVKNILLEGYKKLFAEVDLEKGITDPNSFTAAYLQTMNKQSQIAAMGITTESLTMIRTRFILEWYPENAKKYPFKLFELHQQLLQEGMFDAYNQWIFTAAQSLPVYQNWTTTHAQEYGELIRFQSGRIYKVPLGQYYHQTN